MMTKLTLALTLALVLAALARGAVPSSVDAPSGGARVSAASAISPLSATDRSLQDITELSQQRERWQREQDDAQTNLTRTRDSLATALAANSSTVENIRTEVATWENRLRTASVQVQAVNARLQAAQQAITGGYRSAAEPDLLAVGDTLEVVVLGDDTFNGLYPVRRGGYILIPRVGRIAVAGKDLVAAERAIQDALRENQVLTDPKVIAERPAGTTGPGGAPTPSGNMIFLAGEFAKPGPWTYSPASSPTLLSAILQSGGVSERGDTSKVRLLRLVDGQQLVEYFDVEGMLQGKNFSADVSLKPNDIIVIPAFANIVYVTGNVRQPGIVKLTNNGDLKAYAAILQSGGFARFANPKKVYVLRDLGGGIKKALPININNVQKGLIPDISLQSNDVVVIPESFFSL